MLRKPAHLVLHLQRGLGVPDRGLDLEPVADDRGILHQPLDPAPVEARDLVDIEACERLAVTVALVKDRGPGEPRLRTLEDQELELGTIVMDRNAPLLVVVADVCLAHAAEDPLAARPVVRRKQMLVSQGWILE